MRINLDWREKEIFKLSLPSCLYTLVFFLIFLYIDFFFFFFFSVIELWSEKEERKEKW